MNKFRDLLLTLSSVLLVQLTFMTPVSASLHSTSTLLNQSIHTSPAKQNFSRTENRDTEIAPSIAAFELGMKHLTGDGVQKNIEHAIHLLKYSATSGYTDAQLFLGLTYLAGIDIPTNYKQAHAWLEQAAAQGNSDAQLHLGLMYVNGRGVKQDYAQALSWLRKAAQQQNPAAEFSLGIMYSRSLGVPQDDNLAISWFRKAAQHENAQAQRNLEIIEKKIRDLQREKTPPPTMDDDAQGNL